LTLGGIVLAAVVIFALGVMEGSRIAVIAPPTPAPPAALPTENLRPQPVPALPPAGAVAPDKLTFYDRLSGVAPPTALPEAPPPVRGPAPVTAPLAPQTAAPQPAPTPAPAPAPAKSASTATELAAKTAAPAKATAPAKPAAPAKADAATQIKKLSGKGRYSVQTAAVSDRAAASETAALLKRNGFDAIFAMASIKGKTWYRIRVGSFPSKQAAAQAAGIFHAAYGLNAIPVEN
jgi:septal ring-binding cell division protein DamX